MLELSNQNAYSSTKNLHILLTKHSEILKSGNESLGTEHTEKQYTLPCIRSQNYLIYKYIWKIYIYIFPPLRPLQLAYFRMISKCPF